MGAAIALRDVVGEAQHVLVVAVVPPQRHFTVMPSFSPVMEMGSGSDQRLLGAVEIAHEGGDAALIDAGQARFDANAIIGQR
jgi:hypothetical protein